ncbi:hypothetical protein [Hyphomonas johnsonii]|jgi:hypothetical protein|uniref:EF-hand domain-containing protein n=1 Tax=Hyphomonas johnsonii MHS-2 TaxID=1280950 RepID=A0A059FPZ1_9PROT|nr:hypothetical protein [Hyphomonas johnsonii]KCZ92729.1 hypothetical protein HJO_07237 [Hyphomonas johnsonii MHS-2]
MKKTIAYTALAMLLAAPVALAGNDTALADVDTDMNGYLSLEEVQAADDTVTAETFAEYDVNGDAQLSDVEFESWKAVKKAEEAGDALEDAADDAADAMDDAADHTMDHTPE